jgi:hypothetical protein
MTLSVTLLGPMRSMPNAASRDRTPSHLGLAVNALHVLSHAIVEPGRGGDAREAIRTLWVVTGSHFGLASDADLVRQATIR